MALGKVLTCGLIIEALCPTSPLRKYKRIRCDERSKCQTEQQPPAAVEVTWAYPSPYDQGLPSTRFADISRFRKRVDHWDLKGLLNVWQNSTDEESWPWVWTWHNPVGPHHVFIQLNEDTLSHARSISSKSERNNLTLVVRSIDDLKAYNITPELFYENRCAIIEGVVLSQLDSENKIIMLNDERIICYDYLYL